MEIKTVTKRAHDILVVGGGIGGVSAAVAAARLGCKTALVEKLSFFGGTATASFVAPISGFFLNEQQVVGGIPFEFVKKIVGLHVLIYICFGVVNIYAI